MKYWLSYAIPTVILLVSTRVALSQEETNTPAAPATIQPSLGPVQKSISVSGVFVSDQASEVVVNPKSSHTLRVLESAKHGQNVKKGDVILRLDPEDFAEQVAAQEHAVALLKLQLEEAIGEDKIAETQYQLDREQAELTKKKADEDFKFFMEAEFPFSEKESNENLTMMEDLVAYAAEELRQLEKMYKADDLTEESEEIVLKRARDDLNRQTFSLESAKLNFQRSKQFTIPRSKEAEIVGHRLAEIAFEQFRLTRPLARQRQILSLKKQQVELEKAIKSLNEAKSDLELLTVTAPQSGIVYYGKATEGKWAGITEMKQKLRHDGVVQPKEVLMTIVAPNELSIIGHVHEADVATVTAGAKGHAIPTINANAKLDTVVRTIENVPDSEGNFLVAFDLDAKASRAIVAGMTCSVKLTTYFQPKAISLPSYSVFHEDVDETVHFVYVLPESGKPQKRSVEVGIRTGDRVEVLSGVSTDDKVLTEKPKS